MALPKIDVPVYDLTIPSSSKTIKVRPFTVKEEKLLLMAMESKEIDDIVKTVKQVISNCIIDDEIDINKMPYFDIDYMFIFLRAKSVGDTVEVNMTCNNVLENGETCGHSFTTDMDIAKSEVIKSDISHDIRLDSKNGIKMKYPSYVQMKQIEAGNEIDRKTNIIISCIEYIYDEKNVHSSKDYSKEELKEFIEGLTEANYKKLEEFVDNMPTFAVVLDKDCPKCGFHHHVRYTDFYDFFF